MSFRLVSESLNACTDRFTLNCNAKLDIIHSSVVFSLIKTAANDTMHFFKTFQVLFVILICCFGY